MRDALLHHTQNKDHILERVFVMAIPAAIPSETTCGLCFSPRASAAPSPGVFLSCIALRIVPFSLILGKNTPLPSLRLCKLLQQ